MSIVPQIEQQLVAAAQRRARRPIARVYDRVRGASGHGARVLGVRLLGPAGSRTRVRGVRLLSPAGSRRRGRVALLALVLLLATATITLAATGVILTGASVRPEGQLNPSVGEGVPAPGGSLLLSVVRAPDPEGGLPWGMRVVRTTRGEVCVQIGRVENGQLGELGVDGVFHDDGRFHPMPTDVLPETSRIGARVDNNDASASVSCHLEGQVIAGVHRGVDRSAGAANGHDGASPRGELRDIYYGMLGEPAVSVSYRAGSGDRTVAVLPPLGAYLIVRPAARLEQVGSGNEAMGSEGDLQPTPPLTAITYRLDGKLCRRGPVEPPGVADRLTNPCPRPHWPTSGSVAPRDLHEPVRVHLRIDHRLIAGAQLSFVAPFAVTSARDDYEIRVPSVSCERVVVGGHGPRVGWSGSVASIGRDVARGATVTHWLSGPGLFSGVCGFPTHIRHVSRRSAVIEVVYRQYEGAPTVLVGRATVTEPRGTRPVPEPTGRFRHR
jgi:hypothetical protein